MRGSEKSESLFVCLKSFWFLFSYLIAGFPPAGQGVCRKAGARTAGRNPVSLEVSITSREQTFIIYWIYWLSGCSHLLHKPNTKYQRIKLQIRNRKRNFRNRKCWFRTINPKIRNTKLKFRKKKLRFRPIKQKFRPENIGNQT